MSLEREDIEKRDFPVGRRGYEPEAVDAHLRTVADEVDQLRRSSSMRTESLASSVSEQVRSIVEAAEKSAAEIQQRSEDDARQIRNEAKREARKERAEAAAEAQHEREGAATAAQGEREQASAQVHEYVSRVSDSTAQMLQRIEAMDLELAGLTESLRTGATRLKAELDLLESELQDASAATLVRPAPETPAAGEPELEEPEAVYDEEPYEEEEAVHDEEPEEHEPEQFDEEPTAGGSGPGEDAEGARLIALNMALNGTPREETDRYLSENFELADRHSLLDEVYASVEG